MAPTSNERRLARLAAQARFYQRAFLLSAILNILFMAIGIRGCLLRDTARAILVDGELICLVRSERAAKEVYDAIMAAKKGSYQGEAAFKQKWEDKPWPAKGEKIQTVQEAVERLNPRLDVVVEGFAIQVKGRDVVVLPSPEKAEEPLSTVKAKFLAQGETPLEPQKFVEEPVIVPVLVSPDEVIEDIRTAAAALLSGTDQPQEYIVRPGDTPYAVAKAHGMSLDSLWKLNPGLQEKAKRNDIQPGEKWIVAGPRPTVVVVTRKETTRIVPIKPREIREPRPTMPKGTQRVVRAGEEGQRKEWIRGTWHNANLIPETVEIVRTETLKEPVDRRVLVGTGEDAAPE
ncbi:MAG: G5 domain-containing protein [Candidatus Zipacnadales bacterium]